MLMINFWVNCPFNNYETFPIFLTIKNIFTLNSHYLNASQCFTCDDHYCVITVKTNTTMISK